MESRMLLSRVSSSCKFSCRSITITFSGWAKCLPTVVVTGRRVHYPTACVPDLAYLETFVTYLWYGVGAGDGLRSVGAEALPPSKGACSILPTARHFWAGARTLRPARIKTDQAGLPFSLWSAGGAPCAPCRRRARRRP